MVRHLERNCLCIVGLHCCGALPSRVGRAALQRGSLLAAASHAVAGLSEAQASVAAAPGLQSPGSVAVVLGRVRFPTRNPSSLLQWWAEALPQPPGSPEGIGSSLGDGSLPLASVGFPRGSEVKVGWQCGRPGFDPWVGKIPWRMATHSKILAWRIPWMEEPGGLQSTGLQRVRQD